MTARIEYWLKDADTGEEWLTTETPGQPMSAADLIARQQRQIFKFGPPNVQFSRIVPLPEDHDE